MVEAICCYAFTALMLLAALSVVLNRRPVYSVLSLLVVMCCLAALFVMLGAYFVAALQVLLYAGAVLVLFLFVVMLLNLEPQTRMRMFILRGVGTLAAAGLLMLFWRLFAGHPMHYPMDGGAAPVQGTVEAVGRSLFTTYLVPFELTSFLILAAIIGAVTLAKSDE